MIAIEIELNGEKLAVAGAKDLSVLTAHVAAVGLLGTETVEFRPERGEPTEIQLHVSGMTSRASSPQNLHLNWVPKTLLKPGDVITFRVVEVAEADPPVESLRTPTSEELAAAAAEEKRTRSKVRANARGVRRPARKRANRRGSG